MTCGFIILFFAFFLFSGLAKQIQIQSLWNLGFFSGAENGESCKFEKKVESRKREREGAFFSANLKSWDFMRNLGVPGSFTPTFRPSFFFRVLWHEKNHRVSKKG